MGRRAGVEIGGLGGLHWLVSLRQHVAGACLQDMLRCLIL